MVGEPYNWTRFWVERGGTISLQDGGFLVDPESSAGAFYNPKLVPFHAISKYPVLVLLGEPGIGKTTAVEAAYDNFQLEVQSTGDTAAKYDLREYGSDTELRNAIFRSDTWQAWERGPHRLHLFLDSLDECRLRVDNVAQILAGQLRDCPIERLSLRISCRTAEWPGLLEDELKGLWRRNEQVAQVWGDNDGQEAVHLYELTPLRRRDVVEAATASGVNPDAFLTALADKDVVPLAIKPITLRFLLKSYQKSHAFPGTRITLYQEGCRLLCEETNKSRVASGRTGILSPEQRMALSARIAAVTIFSNCYAVWTGTSADDNPNEADDVAVRQLYGSKESAEGEQFGVTRATVLEALGTGLFSSRGTLRMGWAHQTYAEFLAAWYLVEHHMTGEQIMSLLVHADDPDGRLVPQLHETAAWLASMEPYLFDAVMKADPEVLLRSDIAATSAEDRARLVESLLRQYREGRLLDFDFSTYNLYPKLNYPGLVEQLRPYIAEQGRDDEARRIAIEIAEACGLQALDEDLAAVALDPSEPVEARVNAAAALAEIGTENAKSRLKPLLTDSALAGIEDRLKAVALRVLWPTHLAAQELFSTLTSVGDGHPYSSFFFGSEIEHLQPAGIPVALNWIERLPTRLQREPNYHHIIETIFWKAWEHIETPGVVEPLARLLLGRVVADREMLGEALVTEALAREDEKRHLLLRALIQMFSESDKNPDHIAWAGLVHSKDVPWLLEEVELAAAAAAHNAAKVQSVLSRLVHAALAWYDRPSHEALYWAAQSNQFIATDLALPLQRCDIHSPQGEYWRASEQRLQERTQMLQARPLVKPPPAERILLALDRFENGDLNAWWHLNMDMTLKQDSSHYGNEDETELTKLPGWEDADSKTRGKLVVAATVYLRKQDPKTEEWLGKKNIFDRPMYAAVRAFRLLLREAPSTLDALPDTVWQNWAPALLAFHASEGTDESKDKQELVLRAHHHAPRELAQALSVLIDKENKESGYIYITRYVEDCWGTELENTLLSKLRDKRLTPQSIGRLLEPLLKHRVLDARHYAEALLAPPIRRGTARRRALVAAETLALYTKGEAWPIVWAVITRNIFFGRQLAGRLAHTRRSSERPVVQHLTEAQVADLYVWLSQQYPHTGDEHPKGRHRVTEREDIAHWRDSLLRYLAERATKEAVTAVKRILAEVPGVPEAQYVLHRAKAAMRRRTWVPIKPDALLKLASDAQARLVQNADDLLAMVIESLRRLEGKLQGDTAAAEEAWTYKMVGHKMLWSPRTENHFSNKVKRHLDDDLRQRGIIVNINREPEIRPGHELDLYVEAVVGSASGTEDVVSVVIETKGCWNPKLHSAMETQLVNTYLKDSSSTRGLYLVAWFNCPQWDTHDTRKAVAERLAPNKEQLQLQLDEKARKLSRNGLHIEAVVVNVALPRQIAD